MMRIRIPPSPLRTLKKFKAVTIALINTVAGAAAVVQLNAWHARKAASWHQKQHLTLGAAR